MADDPEPTQSSEGLFIASLEKAMRILESFGEAAPTMGLTELSRATGLDRSAVQRITATFHHLGYLEKDPATRRYSPSVRMSELANSYLWSDDLVRRAMPRLIDLRQDLGETINFARRAGTDIVYTVRLPRARTSYAAMIIGRRVPALNTSSGRAMIALEDAEERRRCVEEWPMHRFTPGTVMCRTTIFDEVERAAKDHYAIAENELQMNELGVAVPVSDQAGRCGAIHCSVSGTDWTRREIESRIAPALQDLANAIG